MRAAAEGLVLLAQRDQALHPPQQRLRVALLGLDVDRLVVVLGVDDRPAGRAAAGWRAEKPALRSALHCIGVRTPLRSPR